MARTSALIGGALARALEKNRGRLNAHVGSLRRAGKAVDGDVLGLQLEECVSPAVDAVDGLDEASSDRVAVALFELSAELLAQDLFLRAPLVREAWRVLLPKYARILRYDARRIAGAITNAVLSLSSARGASPERWISKLGSIAEFVTDSATFLESGWVVAWLSGLAHLRALALERIPGLDGAIVDRLFDLRARGDASVVPSELAAALRGDRWLDPAAPVGAVSAGTRLVARAGGFRAFGGEFLVPPRVFRAFDRLIASDGDSAFEVHVDAFGSSLTPVPGRVSPTSEPLSRDVMGLEGVIEPFTSVSVAGVTAVTLRYSHSILLFASA